MENEVTRSAAPGERPVGAHRFLATFCAIAGLTVAFLALDLFLARVERIETAAHAASLFAEGTRFLAAHRVADAIDRFESAHAMARDSVEYTVALAGALLAARRAPEAEDALGPLLISRGSDGSVNLAMAHVVLARHRIREAISYYHRAIYGEWPGDASGRRDSVRFELIGLLAERGERRELLAELLPLDTAGATIEYRVRLARLFLAAGSPQRSADAFRSLLRGAPGDAGVLAGLGEAELVLGRFRGARGHLRLAREMDPSAHRADSLLALADSAIALDPEDPRIGDTERLRRASSLLRLAVAFAERCAGTSINGALVGARNALAAPGSAHVPGASLDEQANSLITLAAQLVRHRAASCAPTVLDDALLPLLLGASPP